MLVATAAASCCSAPALHEAFRLYITASLSAQELDDFISDELGLAWWMVWYQFLLLIAVSVSAVMGLLRHHAKIFGNFFAALFALQMYISHEAAILNRSADNQVWGLCTLQPSTNFLRMQLSTSESS